MTGRRGSPWPGPDDRLQSVQGRWREERGELTITTECAAATIQTLHVRVAAGDRLLVRR